MAVVNLCGFEAGNASECDSTAGTFSVQSSVTRGAWSAYALRTNPTTTGAGSVRLSALTAAGAGVSDASTVGYVRFYFRFDTAPAAGAEMFLADRSLTNIFLYLTSARTVDVYDGAQALASIGTTVLTVGTWYRIELKCDVSSGTVVAYELKINGVVESSGTGPLGAFTVGGWRLGKSFDTNSQTVDFYFDDYLASSSAYPGAGQCVALKPAANGTYTSGVAAGSSPAATLWQSCSDVPHDSDVTVVNALGNGNACTFALTSSGASGTVSAAKAVAVVRRDGGTNGSVKVRCRSGSTDSDTSAGATAASFAALQKVLAADPATGAAWAVSAVNAAEVGIVESSANASRVTAAYLMVDYTPSAGGAFQAAWAQGSNRVLVAGVL